MAQFCCLDCGEPALPDGSNFVSDRRRPSGIAPQCLDCAYRERLDRYVDRQAGGCWVWRGAVSTGYGSLRIGGEHFYAHRLSYLVHHGDPGDLLVCHTCDNPPCVNPEHLFLGSHHDNLMDASAKGRMNGGGSTSRNLGEANGGARLTEEGVREIRRLVGGGATHRAVAKRFGVRRATIHYVVTGKTWAHVDG